MNIQRGAAHLIVLFTFFALTHAVAGPPENCAPQIISALETLTQPKQERVSNKIPAIAYEDVVLGRFPRLQDVPFYEFQTPEHGHVTVLKVSAPAVRGNQNIARALETWNEHTQSVYQSRLKKFTPGDQQASNPVVESLEYDNRSVVILNSAKSINDGTPELHGGVRLVFARGPGEKLPFQNEFPDATRTGTAVEVGRLTGAGSSPLLLNLAMRVIEQDPEVREIYVHTSRAHVRLYRQMGAIPDHTDERDDLNVILRFGRDRIHKVIETTNQKLGSSAN